MTSKKDNPPEKINVKDLQVDIDDLVARTHNLLTESEEKIHPREFEKSVSQLQNKTQLIVAESTKKMKRFRI